ncbi:MAG: DUF4080 domain-containing protein [Limisphaerales bacterium]
MAHPTGNRSILLLGINAKFIHASFGLRYLKANLGALKSDCVLLEFDINQRAIDIVEKALETKPCLIGIGVYIWNAPLVRSVVHLLKKVSPQTIVVLGGPEVSFEIEQQDWLKVADHVITGEGDLAFRKVCETRLGLVPSGSNPPWVIHGGLPELSQVAFPYEHYSEEDLRHRVVYVEASRGCPFTCEFCLSSLDAPVRGFNTKDFLAQMQGLLDRGLRHFKFVDRTFNLNIRTSSAILDFFIQNLDKGLFLHFEMIPDRLPEPLKQRLTKFPPGCVQLEIGVQTLNPRISDLISRKLQVDKLCENLRFLRNQTQAHLHVDLIVGLPGESLQSFGEGFNQLLAQKPHEIQIGILKRLRGTPIIRHDQAFQMEYDSEAPYEVLATSDVSFSELQRMKRFARYWDLVANSGRFKRTMQSLCHDQPNPFEAFMNFSDWLYAASGQRHGIALTKLVQLVFNYLTESPLSQPHETTAQDLWLDYQESGKSDMPLCLRPHLMKTHPKTVAFSNQPIAETTNNGSKNLGKANQRQLRHIRP